MKKYVAEFVGTFTLVLFGCGTAVVAGQQVGNAGIAFAFGFALVAMAYGIGPVSGCHINPAVSLGVFMAGRISRHDLVGYVVSQILGGIAGAAVLAVIANGMLAGYSVSQGGLGQNGWGQSYLGGYSLLAAMVFEFVATFLFVTVILGSTRGGAPTAMAGLAIGITLTAIHLFGINITGTSVNPARSLGPALLVGGTALAQVWMFLVVPSLGGVVAGVFDRTGILAPSE
ncbi:MAG TPA: aquaporin [Terriglobia bacterium]|nr:aquaporin [Terriglobia bacterium]